MSFAHSNVNRIDNSQFTDITTINEAPRTTTLTTIINEAPRTKDASTTPMKILLRHAAMAATHESAIATYAPRCKPGTRKQVIADLVNWARQPPRRRGGKILWFSGPAGSGKTCVQREVAHQLHIPSSSGGKPDLAASYFFSNRMSAGDSDTTAPRGLVPAPPGTAGLLDKVDPFIATIVYQLIVSVPALKEYVEKAIDSDPLIFDKGPDVQARKIISEPLSAWKAATTPVEKKPNRWTSVKRSFGRLIRRFKKPVKAVDADPDTVVIDGWDEIRNVEKRKQLLNVIRDLALHDTVPLRFIIASRPEYDIRTMFSSAEFEHITRHVKLEDYNGDDDIRSFICEEFKRIRLNHPAGGAMRGWPPQKAIDIIVDKASGSFIYPSVVVSFLDNPRRHPVEMLNHVIGLASQQREGIAQPLAELYSLYNIIFQPADVDRGLLKQILHSIHVIDTGSAFRGYDFYDQLLSLPLGTTSILLCDLHSLIDASGNLKFHHKTAIDYLLDPLASGDIYQPLHETNAYLVTCCIDYLERWFTQTEEARLEELSGVLGHAAFLWDHYAGNAMQSQPISLAHVLQTFDPRISWIALFLVGTTVSMSQSLRIQIPFIHETLCTAEECKLFCKQVHHLIEVEEHAKAIQSYVHNSDGWWDMSLLQQLRTQEYKSFLKMLKMDS